MERKLPWVPRIVHGKKDPYLDTCRYSRLTTTPSLPTLPCPTYPVLKAYPFIIAYPIWIPSWESGILSRCQSYPTLDTYLSVSFPEHLPYSILPTIEKIPLPILSTYPTQPTYHIHLTQTCILIPTSHYLHYIPQPAFF